MDLLQMGLAPFVDRAVQSAIQNGRQRVEAVQRFAEDPVLGQKPIRQWDAAGLLKLMWGTWNDVFSSILGRTERSLVQELREWRNKWAHQEPFSIDDTDRALDSMVRLLSAISAPQAGEINTLKMELRRLAFDGHIRDDGEFGGSLSESTPVAMRRPSRDVAMPYLDVQHGRRQETILENEILSRKGVRVTRTIALIDHISYPINGITAVYVSSKGPTAAAFWFQFLIGCGVIVTGLVLLIQGYASGEYGHKFYGYSAITIGSLYAGSWLLLRSPIYLLTIRTAAGDTQILRNSDRSFIYAVREAIETAVATRG